MFVVKRSGRHQSMRFDNVTKRLVSLVDIPPRLANVDPCEITQHICASMNDGMTTREVDELCITLCADKSNSHPDFSTLATRLLLSNLHKERAGKTFSDVYLSSGRCHPETAAYVRANSVDLDSMIDYDRDYHLKYFGIRTLQNGYLQPGELPQDLFMRVSVFLHQPNLEDVRECYNTFSRLLATQATPTLFNAGTDRPQLASCFLTCVSDDSVDGIFDTVKRCAHISKYAGGLGISITNVRGRGSPIYGTNGFSDGVVPMLKTFESTAKYINQGGKRKGSFATYMEPWHTDIMDWVRLRRNDGLEDMRCRELFFGLWIPDIFMRRVKSDGMWTLFCPKKHPQLLDLYGVAFDLEYERLEAGAENRLRARDLWMEIMETQATTGMPYMCYKDASNRKSNQKNLGTIRCSNLCTEIMQYSGPDETAVCNLASLSLSAMVRNGSFDFGLLGNTTRTLVRTLNQTIDRGFYPTECARRSNTSHRPIGIGVQGLANVFMKLRMPFDSEEASSLNRRIFERIYLSAVRESADLARRFGPYSSYDGSPASQGTLSHDLWGKTDQETFSDWGDARAEVAQYGLRNSLLVAPMPTASTAQILGNYEAFEPLGSNMYTRRVLSGEYHVVNELLIKDLEKLGLWDANMKDELIRHGGSVQNIASIPTELKELYKTAYEIRPRVLIQMAADRAIWVDQSQSLNIFLDKPTSKVLSAVAMLGWELGLKTGSYYIRSKPAAQPQKVSLPVECLACSA